MTSKTISLKKEAYDRLKKEKSEGESFSDVVLDLTKGSKNNFSNMIGKNVNFSWEDVKESRKRSKRDKKREKVLSGH